MSLTQAFPGDKITSQIFNSNTYYLLKGIPTYEDTITLADNVAGTLRLRPTNDPGSVTQLFQIMDEAGTVKLHLDSDGSITTVGTLATNGSGFYGGGLTVTGNEVVGGDLSVTGDAIITGNLNTFSNFGAIGVASFGSNVWVRGDITMQPLVDPAGSTPVFRMFNAAGVLKAAIDASGEFYSAGGATFNGNIIVNNGYVDAVNGLRTTTGPSNLVNSTLAGFTFLTGSVGFYSTLPIGKQTVTGAKGGNAALTSLMAALVAIGLFTDTTT
jgi:hypothetical protein